MIGTFGGAATRGETLFGVVTRGETPLGMTRGDVNFGGTRGEARGEAGGTRGDTEGDLGVVFLGLFEVLLKVTENLKI